MFIRINVQFNKSSLVRIYSDAYIDLTIIK
jgi:hypothetical protein